MPGPKHSPRKHLPILRRAKEATEKMGRRDIMHELFMEELASLRELQEGSSTYRIADANILYDRLKGALSKEEKDEFFASLLAQITTQSNEGRQKLRDTIRRHIESIATATGATK